MAAWLGQFVRSLPSSHKVLVPIPVRVKFEYLCAIFSAIAYLAFHLSGVGQMSISICWELTCDGLVSSPDGVKHSYPLKQETAP